jgi:hypothetical protein
MVQSVIVLNAWGKPAGSVLPRFRLLVDGIEVGQGTVGKTLDDYRYTLDLAPGQPHEVVVVFDNPGKVGGARRTLFVESIEVNGHTHLPTDPGVTFDRGAIDGINVTDGQTKLTTKGGLVFDIPPSEVSAPVTDPTPPPGSTDPQPAPAPAPEPAPTANSDGGMWVWNTREVITDVTKLTAFISSVQQAGLDDVYLYLRSGDYRAYEAELKGALAALSAAGIKAWGLEGYRGYFSDMYGPAGLYAAADSLVAYNTKVAPNQRFAGFMSDLEPQDGADAEAPTHFHNGIPDSKLTFQQAAEREALMRDWITMHDTLSDKMHAAGLKYGASMVSWVDDYYGEEVTATYNGVDKGVMKHIMPLIDDYVVMSYNTDPANAANRLKGELQFADTLTNGPRVYAAVETHTGVGSTISYGDSPTKDSKAAVLNDIKIIDEQLSVSKSFAGVSIHDWVGWELL